MTWVWKYSVPIQDGLDPSGVKDADGDPLVPVCAVGSGCVASHWSVSILPGATPYRNLDSPPHHPPIVISSSPH